MFNIKERIEKIDRSTLISIERDHFVFQSDNGCRTTFLKMDKVINKGSKLEIGKDYRLEHINGKAKIELL